jgi:16S rRNA (guanine966-N2)-methyltransferase
LIITGGAARGIRLKIRNSDSIRPAMGRMREAVFSSLGPGIAESVFLDLFAGSGAYGLEALSRGASGGVFIEKDHRTIGYLEENLSAVCKSLGLKKSPCDVLELDVIKWIPTIKHRFDFIFVDPPYDTINRRMELIFTLAQSCLSLHASSRLIFEAPGELELMGHGWEQVKKLGKGRHESTVSFFRRI